MFKDQDVARKSFEQYLTDSGVKVRYIAQKIGCHESSICHWRKGRDMRTGLYMKLVSFLLTKKAKL